jgi:hypothetical protein
MGIGKWITGFVWVASASLTATGQNNCGATPPAGTCAAPAPVQTWCAGNNSASTCAGGNSWIGFLTSSPASGSWSRQFEGLDASSILNSGRTPGAQADANGGVGPTDSNGVGQYLEYADNFIQAFDRATGNGIFSNGANSGAAPQPISSLFAPRGSTFCSNPSLDGIATYGRLDGVFVIGNIFHPGGTYYYCIGVSAPTGSEPANNLEGQNFQSHWNVYAYNISAAIPRNASGAPYFPDYARFGSWQDGFYVSWDLEDVNANFDIVGFEVCKLDKADIIAGLSSDSPTCYTYIPSYVTGTGGTNNSLIHTLLPADFEGGNPIPDNTAGEYFLAQVNPSNPGTNVQCSKFPCTSSQLAFWTWSDFVNGAGPTFISVPAYTPGCYSPSHPYNTYCIPEPSGHVIDSLGDRLTYRLAYRYLTNGGIGEYLAVAHAIQMGGTRRTGIRVYSIRVGASPTVVYSENLQDTVNDYYFSMPSVAMDQNGDVGVTYTVTGNASHGSRSNYDPSPFFATLNSNGVAGTPVAILSDSGSSGQDETDSYWGEYESVSSDPDDDLTYWAVDQYMNGNQVSQCSFQSRVGSGCTWASRVFTCQKGNGC